MGLRFAICDLRSNRRRRRFFARSPLAIHKFEIADSRPKLPASLSHVLLLLPLLLTGCPPAPPVRGCYGPTLTLRQVVDRVNANNEPVRSLWARHRYEAWIYDDRGKDHYVRGDGNMVFRKPTDLYVKAEAALQTAFDLGVNGQEYWMTVLGDTNTQWWGRLANVGKPCSRPIPVRPDLMLEVLGVSDIDTNLLEPPLPVMRFNNDQCAYMFVWSAPQSDRWAATKEVWYDYKTYLPRMVLLFDPNGRILVRAYLGNHQPVGGSEGRKVATHYDIFFPETRNRMILDLRDVELQHNGIPREGSIRRRPIGGAREVQLDEDCGS